MTIFLLWQRYTIMYKWLHYLFWQTLFFLQKIGPINCLWSGFGQWSRCSVSCGTGTQQRKRMVLQKAKNGGDECSGEAVETRPCTQPLCPGKWNTYVYLYTIVTYFSKTDTGFGKQG